MVVDHPIGFTWLHVCVFVCIVWGWLEVIHIAVSGAVVEEEKNAEGCRVEGSNHPEEPGVINEVHDDDGVEPSGCRVS